MTALWAYFVGLLLVVTFVIWVVTRRGVTPPSARAEEVIARMSIYPPALYPELWNLPSFAQLQKRYFPQNFERNEKNDQHYNSDDNADRPLPD